MHTPCDCSLWWWGVARASTQLAVAKLLRRFRYVCLACLALYLSTYSPPLHPILFDQPSYPSATWGHTIHTFLIKLTIGRCKLLLCLPGPLSVHMYSPYPSTPYQTISRTSLVTQFPHFSSHWPELLQRFGYSSPSCMALGLSSIHEPSPYPSAQSYNSHISHRADQLSPIGNGSTTVIFTQI